MHRGSLPRNAFPLALLAGCLVTAASRADDPTPAPKTKAPARVLPGVRPDGSVQLPNQWRLKPAGTQVEVGSFPMQLVPHPGGR